MWWILYGYYVMFMCGGQNSWFCQAPLRICYVTLFECKSPWMLKTVSEVVFATFLLVCFVFLREREHLQNKEKCFLFHFRSSPSSRDNQLLTF